VAGKVVHPKNIVIHDGEDPYLVVAADKGTAHLSDTANSVAQEQGFWLDDAFASGGSHGYDHKVVGITAKGAWVCVRRHFYELGVDPETDIITAVGIGDMAGDVFGNGLLLSKTIKLLAAFNHMHIFVDPDPDPERSWAERNRLFELPRSKWSDYDPTIISEGGGVFDRYAKEIKLSPQMRKVLATDAQTLSGEQMIKHILRADVDLLWNGGIGTYFKARFETHADASDPANDNVRIDADRLRARVIGEGGNLGLTQAARVEAAQRGTRLYTDAIDNSGGVDMSDHEVNLKILFAQLMADGKMTRSERNELLERVEGEVADKVLANNYNQALVLSCDFERSRQELPAFVRLIEDLENRDLMHAMAEGMPDGVELARRAQAKQGLTRPELAKLTPFVKMEVYDSMREDEAFTGIFVDRAFRSYWPKEVLERCGEAINDHQLKKEIAATVLSNLVVDQAGATFFNETVAASGHSITEVALAYLLAMELLDTRNIYKRFDALVPNMRAGVHIRVRNEMHNALDVLTHWLLTEHVDLDDPESVLTQLKKPFVAYRKSLPDPLPLTDRREHARRVVWYRTRNIPDDLGLQLAGFIYWTRAGDVARLAEKADVSVRTAAHVLNQIGSTTHIHTAFKLIRGADPSDRFERSAMDLLRSELRHLRHGLTLRALAARRSKRETVRTTVSRFRSTHQHTLARILDTARYIHRAKATGIAPAVTLSHRIKELLDDSAD